VCVCVIDAVDALKSIREVYVSEVWAPMHLCTYAPMHLCTYAPIPHTLTHTHTHTYTHTHTHTHTGDAQEALPQAAAEQ
jgi:hypothetical protein